MRNDILLLFGGAADSGLLHSGDRLRTVGNVALGADDEWSQLVRERERAVADFANVLEAVRRDKTGSAIQRPDARAKPSNPAQSTAMPFRSAENDVMLLFGSSHPVPGQERLEGEEGKMRAGERGWIPPGKIGRQAECKPSAGAHKASGKTILRVPRSAPAVSSAVRLPPWACDAAGETGSCLFFCTKPRPALCYR